jgi:hypothetical protein
MNCGFYIDSIVNERTSFVINKVGHEHDSVPRRYGRHFKTGDTIGVEIDRRTSPGKLIMYVNGVSCGVATTLPVSTPEDALPLQVAVSLQTRTVGTTLPSSGWVPTFFMRRISAAFKISPAPCYNGVLATTVVAPYVRHYELTS